MNSITQDNHQDIILSEKLATFAKKYRIREILRSSNANFSKSRCCVITRVCPAKRA